MFPGKNRFIRYAIYTRQSVDRGDGLSSCDVQFQTCQDFAKATGEPGLHWTGHRFDDVGYSGATLDRPGIRKLQKVIDLGGLDRIYAVALDRLTRNMRDAVVLLDQFDKARVELRFVHQAGFGGGAQQRFMRHILAAFAEFERDIIKARLADARASLRRRGRRLAGKVPYGYDADTVTKQLVPNKREARRVQTIFRRAAERELPRQIASACNKRGWKTKIYVSKRSGKTTGGGQWTARQIVSLLRNPVYVGRFAHGKKSRHGVHKAIVDLDAFEAVQNALDSRRTTDQHKRHRYDGFMFRQKIVCPRCGRFLTTYTITKKTSSRSALAYRYYSCRSTAGGRPGCKGIQYSAWDVEETVRGMLLEPDDWRDVVGLRETDEYIEWAIDAWSTMPRSWQTGLLTRYVQRIEINPRESQLLVSFDARFSSVFSDAVEALQRPGR